MGEKNIETNSESKESQINILSLSRSNIKFPILSKSNKEDDSRKNFIQNYLRVLEGIRDKSIEKEILFYQKIGFSHPLPGSINFESYLYWVIENSYKVFDLFYAYLWATKRDISQNNLEKVFKCFSDQRFYDGLWFKSKGNYYKSIREMELKIFDSEPITVQEMFQTINVASNAKKGLEVFFNKHSKELNEEIDEIIKKNKGKKIPADKLIEYINGLLKKDMKEIGEKKQKEENLTEQEEILLKMFIGAGLTNKGNSQNSKSTKVQEAYNKILTKAVYTFILKNFKQTQIMEKLDNARTTFNFQVDGGKGKKLASLLEEMPNILFGSKEFYDYLDEQFNKFFPKEDANVNIIFNLSKGKGETINYTKKDKNGQFIRTNQFITNEQGSFNVLTKYLNNKKIDDKITQNESCDKNTWKVFKENLSAQLAIDLMAILKKRILDYQQEGEKFDMTPLTKEEFFNKIEEYKDLDKLNISKNQREIANIIENLKDELILTFQEYIQDYFVKEENNGKIIFNKDSEGKFLTAERMINSLFNGIMDFNIKGNIAELIMTSFLKKYGNSIKMTGKIKNTLGWSMHADLVLSTSNNEKIGLQSKVKISEDEFTFYGKEQELNTFGKGIPRYLTQDALEIIRTEVFDSEVDKFNLASFLNNYIKNFWRIEDMYLKDEEYVGTQNNFFIVNYQLIPVSLIIQSMIDDIIEKEKQNQNQPDKQSNILNWNFNSFFNESETVYIKTKEEVSEGQEETFIKNYLRQQSGINIYYINDKGEEQKVDSVIFNNGITFKLSYLKKMIEKVESEIKQKMEGNEKAAQSFISLYKFLNDME